MPERHPADSRELKNTGGAPTGAPISQVLDVLIATTGRSHEAEDADFDTHPPVTDDGRPFDLGEGVRLDRLAYDDAELVMNACMPRGHFFFPTRQYGQRYAYIYEPAEAAWHANYYGWDPEGRINAALQLSRLVHDNTDAMEYAARLFIHEDGARQVVPRHDCELGRAYSLHRGRDWLDATDAAALRRLLSAYWAVAESLPDRVRRALRRTTHLPSERYVDDRLAETAIALESLINAGRARAGEVKTRLVPDPDQAPVIIEIFHLWADKGWGCKAIADHLNRPGGPPSPSHVDPRRNLRGDWAKSSLRAMLRNPTYTGRLVWNRLDFATQREAGGTARLRAEEEWVVSEVEHLPLVSDELFARAQERFRQNGHRTNGRRNGQAAYLFTGMVRCASGHQPLAMYGRKRKQHTYLTCDYGRTYGKTAAEQIDGHGQWLSLREDALLPLVETFFAQRIFGPMRLEKLERQLVAHQRNTRRGSDAVQRRLRESIADVDERIGRQIEALERGIEPDLIAKRIAKLRKDKETAEAELRVLHPSDPGSDATEDLREALRRMPDLSQGLRDAPTEVKRQVFDAFGLQIVYDKPNRRIEISATITEAIAHALHNAEDLPEEAFVAHTDIAGAGFEPATFGL